MSEIGKNIKRFRQDANMTQDELAERLNVTRQAISSWECDKTQPDIDTLKKIADILQVSVESLIYGKKSSTQVITNTKTVKTGGSAVFTVGACLAMILSYAKWSSIGWAILHGFLNWIYVIYYVIKY